MPFDLQSKNLTIPLGVVFFAPFLPGTLTPGIYEDLGNCPEFSLSPTNRTLDRAVSRGGSVVLSESYSIGGDLAGSWSTESITTSNLSKWLQDDGESTSAQSVSGVQQSLGNLKRDAIVQIGRTPATPFGVRNIASLVVRSGGVLQTEHVDYDLDRISGMVTFRRNLSAVTLTYSAHASNYREVAVGFKPREGEVKFISQNQIGQERTIIIPRAQLTPQGTLSMISDARSPSFQRLGFAMKALRLANYPLAISMDSPLSGDQGVLADEGISDVRFITLENQFDTLVNIDWPGAVTA